MAKKKHKNPTVNPHKLSAAELKERIDGHLEREKLGAAYDLVKVLVQRFDTVEHQALFRRILEAKLKAMGDGRSAKDAAGVVAEAKKRFSGIQLGDAEELVRLTRMRDGDLVAAFRERETIPDSFRYRIADALYFSEKPDRDFIRKHKTFKDVFFVKEAFADGFDPERTRQLLSALGPDSPYRPWILLRKAIEAFAVDDDVSLKVLNTKMPGATFPAFIVDKLTTCRRLLQGQSDGFLKISDPDLKVMKALCGPSFVTRMLLRRLAFIVERRRFDQIRPLMSWAGRHLPTSTAGAVAVLALGMVVRKISGMERRYHFFKQSNWFPRCDAFYLDRRHLLIKFFPKETIEDMPESKLIYQCYSSEAIKRHGLFKIGELKAELLVYEADCIQADMVGLLPLFFRGLKQRQMQDQNDRWRVELLEKALKQSCHNPAIMVSLVKLYVKQREKRSKVNRVLDMLLKSFPENPEGYRLAGEIAKDNKAYQKAIGFYSQARELSPLNRELLLSQLQCYEGIIDKRSRKDAHLVDRDLAAADAWRGRADPPSVTEAFGRITFKAVLKKVKTEILPFESGQSQLLTILETDCRQADGPDLLRLIRLIDQEGLADTFAAVLQKISRLISDCMTPADFGQILTVALDRDTESLAVGKLFSELLVMTVRSDLKDQQISIEQYGQWMIACLQSKWHRTFVMLLVTAYHRYSDHRPFLLLVEGLRFSPDHKIIRRCLSDRKAVEWFTTPTGSRLLEELGPHAYLFDQLEYMIEEEDWGDIDDLISLINDELEVSAYSFSRFRPNLDERCDFYDTAPVERLGELIGDDYVFRREDPFWFHRFGRPNNWASKRNRKAATDPSTTSTPASEGDEAVSHRSTPPAGEQLSFLDNLETDE